jgi:hypothetical protein
VGPYPSDLYETGCRINAKTCPVVPVMFPRPEKVKRRSVFMIFEFSEHFKIDICSVNCKCTIYPFPDVQKVAAACAGLAYHDPKTLPMGWPGPQIISPMPINMLRVK